MTERQMTTHDKSDRMGEAEKVAKGFIMAESDPPFVEKKFIDDIIGHGVFATQNLNKGDFIMEYQGDLISQEEAQKREKRYDADGAGSFMVYFRNAHGKRLCVDATARSTAGLGRFVNDGWKKEKNSFLKEVQSEHKPHVCLFASRAIPKGEEIRFDYGVPDLPWRNHNRRTSKTPAKDCEVCQGCLTKENCRKCRACQDMKRYGGPGRMKQKCLKRKCLNRSSSRSKTPASQANSTASQFVTSDGMIEVCASPLTSQSLSCTSESCNRMGERKEDGLGPESAKSTRKVTKKKRKRPYSQPSLYKTKRRRKNSYSAVTPRKTQSFKGNNKIFKSPARSTTTQQSPRDPRTHVYDFTTGIKNCSVQSDKELTEAVTTDCSEVLPVQEKHQDIDDVDIAWFDGECAAGSDDVDQNIQVCTQNDMSYLTQTRFRKDPRGAMMKALGLKPISDDTVQCYQDVTRTSINPKHKVTKRKEVRQALFGEKDTALNGNSECGKLAVASEGDADKDDMENSLDTNSASKKSSIRKQDYSRKKKKKKISFIPQSEHSCVFPLLEKFNSPQMVADHPRQKSKETSESSYNRKQVEPVSTDSDARSDFVKSYHQLLADILTFLEEILDLSEDIGSINRSKLAKKIKRKKSAMHELLSEVSMECPEPGESMNESNLCPTQRKLEGDLAAEMLKNLYRTLMSQTAECFQEKLDETSYEIKVTFKKDGEEDTNMEESLKQTDDELKDDDSFDTKPETWRDISVVVRYTKEAFNENTAQLQMTKKHIEDTMALLDTKIHQLKEGEGSVRKILKKTIKKIKKKMLKVSLPP